MKTLISRYLADVTVPTKPTVPTWESFTHAVPQWPAIIGSLIASAVVIKVCKHPLLRNFLCVAIGAGVVLFIYASK